MVLSNLIRDLQQIGNQIHSVSYAFNEYIKYNKDSDKFTKHMEKVVNERRKEDAKNRASDSVSDNK